MPEVEVDMLRSARDAQFEPLTFLGPGFKKVIAPAKVNLFLGIGRPTESGYHEVETVMHATTLHDVLYVNVEPRTGTSDADLHEPIAGPNDAIAVNITISDKTVRFGEAPLEIPLEKNLCFKAVDLLARTIDHSASELVTIHIEKNIPAQAGLGGGSSDAAATLLALASFWGIASSDPVLLEVATQLGADVAFFLYGGCVLLTGVGEIFQHALEPSKQSLVLVKPDGGVSTAAAYAAFDASPSYASATLLATVEQATRAAEVPLFNNLAKASESVLPELIDVRQWLAAQEGITDEADILLCGSGAATFALTQGFGDASRIAGHAKQQGYWARPAALSSLRVALAS